MIRRADWKRSLRCPECYGELLWQETESGKNTESTCRGCGRRFESTRDGTPVLFTPPDLARFGPLLAEVDGARMEEIYARRTRRDWAGKLRRALAPPVPVYYQPSEPTLPTREDGLNLLLGGGGSRSAPFINVDLAPFVGVDLVANAGRLPFAEGSCDSVACDALLEHVEDPVAIVNEIERVLKPGGHVLVVVPFCHPWHGYPSDYQRFSRQGLAYLLRNLECVSEGLRTGPTTTLLTFLTYYGKLVFPVHGGNVVRRWFNRAVMASWGWASAPLRYLDIWLNRLPDAHVLANHIYFLARKPEAPSGSSSQD